MDDSELAELEALSKGYRQDVYVLINNELFNVIVYDIARLQQDFESEIQIYNYYLIEPNLVIVSEVSISNIIFTIERLAGTKYFELLKPINDIDLSKLKRVK